VFRAQHVQRSSLRSSLRSAHTWPRAWRVTLGSELVRYKNCTPPLALKVDRGVRPVLRCAQRSIIRPRNVPIPPCALKVTEGGSVLL